MPSLFNLIHLLLSFASRLNIFSSKPSLQILYFLLHRYPYQTSHFSYSLHFQSHTLPLPTTSISYLRLILVPSKPIFKQNFPYKRYNQVRNFPKGNSYNSYTSWRRWYKFSSNCSNIGKVERCQVVVRADIVVFVDGVPIRFPISLKPYFTKDKANELGDEIGEFKSKIELAQLEEAMKFFDIDYVVFDSWYTTFIRFIEEKGLKWVGQLKSNRIVKIEGWWMPLSGSETVWGLNKKSSSSFCCFQARIEGIGEVKIVLVDEGGGRISL
jgi:hypothetical protein